MQDFNYVFTNCYEITLELSCCKYPPAGELVNEWNTNKNALLTFMEQVHMGVKGVVKEFGSGRPVDKAAVWVDGIDHNVTTTDRGEFWRLLLPGQYTLRVSCPGYKDAVKRGVEVHSGRAVWAEVILEPVETTESPAQNAPVDTDFELLGETVFKHHSFQELVEILENLTHKYPHLTRLFSIGKSVEHRELYVLEISDNPGVHEPGEPEFKYVGNIHGNEVVGREMLLLLARLLCEQYGRSQRLTSLVNNTRIFIMPSMNPDGYERSHVGDRSSTLGRFNAHDKDLNRDFPDQYQKEESAPQPETAAMMRFVLARPVVLSASLHGGALVANYPYDGNKEKVERIYSATPDDALFRHLALSYSKAHPTMSQGKPCPKGELDDEFKDGITNGAAWYNVYGGMQDYNYLHSNSYELTIEMGCFKYPPASQLEHFWRDHRVPLVVLMEKVHVGVKGFVKDEHDKPVTNATIHILGIHHDVRSARDGDFWRLLVPGSYSVQTYVDGFPSPEHRVSVSEGRPTWVNFTVNREYARWSKVHDFLIGENGEAKYLDSDELTNLLMQLRDNHSDILEVKASYGPPGETALQLIRITAKGNRMKPEVLLVGGLDGDRPVGREMLIRLARHLVTGYVKNDTNIRSLLEAVAVHIVPTVDEAGFRRSLPGVCEPQLAHGEADLPDIEDRFGSEHDGKFAVVEAVKKTLASYRYVAGLLLQSGGRGIRVPLNASNSGVLDTLTLDRLVEGFRSQVGRDTCNTTQGALQGSSMLHYAYSRHGALMASVDLDCCNYPSADKIPGLWMKSLHPLMKFLNAAKTSVFGSVTDEYGTKLTNATIGVHTSKRPIDVSNGAFCLAVPPGRVVLTAVAPSFEMRVERLSVTEGEVASLALVLEPDTYEHKYHGYPQILQLLRDIAKRHPNTTHLYSLGRSAGGRELHALALGARPLVHRQGVPEVRLQAGLGASQAASSELLVHLAHCLATRYRHNTLITQIMSSTRIHIIPVVDPDGMANESSTDCNETRALSDHGKDIYYAFKETSKRPEVLAFERWARRYPFITSLSVLTGATAVVTPEARGKTDSAMLDSLAKAYVESNDDMLVGNFSCGGNQYNTSGGIVRGPSNFASVEGSLMEFSYKAAGTYELSAFVSCCAAPDALTSSSLWVANKQSLLQFLIQASHAFLVTVELQSTHGLTGFVRTKSGDPIGNANITVDGQAMPRPTTHLGEFWIPLGEGVFTLVVSATDYFPMTKIVTVYPGRATNVEFRLQENILVAGLPKHVFVVMAGSLVLLAMVSALCIYSVVLSRRHPQRAGFQPIQSNGATLFDDDDDEDDHKVKKLMGFGVHRKLLKTAEYHDESSSEDEIYNTRTWKNGK
ncbi:unnamed protein product [Ixodes hexagonus]